MKRYCVINKKIAQKCIKICFYAFYCGNKITSMIHFMYISRFLKNDSMSYGIISRYVWYHHPKLHIR